MAHQMSPEEERVCSLISDRLIRDGLYFVGIDVIGGKLMEVNCISPGGHASDQSVEWPSLRNTSDRLH